MSQGPLTPLSIGILLALGEGDKHGYAILKDVERQTGREVSVGTGTLYAALQRMQAEGLIEAVDREPDPGEDARRKYYRITEEGRAIARQEVARLSRIVEIARARELMPDVG